MWITKKLLKEGFEEICTPSSKFSNICDDRVTQYTIKKYKNSKINPELKKFSGKDIVIQKLCYYSEYHNGSFYAVRIIK